MLATVLQITGYAILSPAPAFSIMCVAFFTNGMGMSLLDAQCNSYFPCCTIRPPLHGFPYSNFVVLLKGRGYDEILSEIGALAQEHEEVELTRAAAPAPEESVAESGGPSGDEGGESVTMSRKARDSSSFAMVLKQVHVHILAAFVFIYVGLEVTIGGW